jgi:hypothetical protein
MSSYSNKSPVIFLSEIDWDYLWQRHQIFATKYSEKGHEVYYVNRLGMRGLRIKDVPYIFKRLWLTVMGRAKPSSKKNRLHIINPIFFPGSGSFSEFLNMYIFVPTFIREAINND